MIELLAAITNAYNTDDGPGGAFTVLRAANTGGLFTEEAAQGTPPPYIVLHHLGTTPEYIMGGGELKSSSIQFVVVASSSLELVDIEDKLKDAFDDLSLAYDTEQSIVMERVEEGDLIKEINHWSTTVDYRVIRYGRTAEGQEVIEHLYNLLSIH